MSPQGLPFRLTPLLLLAGLVVSAFVYLSGLSLVGVLGPDEPRYAAIGNQMAVSGDWVTPVLWGEKWFEKPPLVYWMTALGRLAGLNDELAPRFPVAVLSLAFLALFYAVLRRLEGDTVAALAAMMLSASGGWIAYSHVGVMDVPLAATFGGSLLLGLLWLETSDRRALYSAGALFGLSLLAKGLVAGILILPFLWFGRRKWRGLLAAGVLAFLVAAPWYAAVWIVNGRAFFEEFILRHHLSRFTSDELQHVQPIWFYVPVLIGGLFPWTPLLAVLRPECWRGERRLILAATIAFGFVFFSLSTNKLPGYILPLLPALFALMAIGIEATRVVARPLALSVFLLVLCPVIAVLLPEALLAGLRRASLGEIRYESLALVVPLAAATWFLERSGRRMAAFALAAALACAGYLYVKRTAFPVIDQVACSRSLWRRVRPYLNETCIDSLHRSWRYGLNYYTRAPLPDCAEESRRLAIRQLPGGLPRLEFAAPRKPQ